MSDTCKIDPPTNMNSNPDTSDGFKIAPLRQMQLAIRTPVLVTPAIQLSVPTPPRLFTDQQLVIILVIVIALLCAVIVVYARRG